MQIIQPDFKLETTPSADFYLKAGLTAAQQRILPKVNQIAHNIFEGAYPAHVDAFKTREMQRILTEELGITHYVCLIDNKQLQRFVDYRKQFRSSKKPQWIHFQIVDQKIAKDAEVKAFTDKLVELCKDQKNKVFIHCWGGNGRTNTIAAIVLSKLFGWSWEKSLTHLYKCYLQRNIRTTDHLPETKVQFEQVKRLCKGSNINFQQWRHICRTIKAGLRGKSLRF